MRIDCEQCGAAYSIDDALITERGVRAQCPKCGTQKVVKKQAAAAPNPFGAPVGGAAANAGAAGNPFGAPSGGANPFAPPSTAPPSPPPMGAMGNPFGAPLAGAAPNPFGAPPAVAASNPFAAIEPPPPPPPMGNPGNPGNPFGAPAFASPPSTAPSNPFAATVPTGNPFTQQNSAVGGAPPTVPSPFNPPVASPFGDSNQLLGAPTPAPFQPPSGYAPPAPVGGGAAAPSPFAPPMGDPFAAAGAAAPSSMGGAPDPFAAPATDPFAKLAQAPVRGAMGGNGPPPGAVSPVAAPRNPPPQPAPDPFGTSSPPQAASSPPKAADPFASLDLGGPTRSDAPAPAAGRWRVKTRGGMDAEVDLAQLRELVRGGQVSVNDEAAPVGEPLKPIHTQPLLSVAVTAKPTGKKVAGARAWSPPSLGRMGAVIGGIVAVVLVVGGVVVLAPQLFERATDAGVNPLRRAKPTWEKQFPDVGGTAQEHIDAGRAQMKLDTAAGYRKADDELRQALLLDIGNVTAIAAWVENFTSLPAVRSDPEALQLAREAIDYASKREPKNVEVLRADGLLKLAANDVDGAQRRLEEAKRENPGDVYTLLALAKSHLDRNPSDGLALVQQVRGKEPGLKAALVIEGAAQRRLGGFKEARDALGGRLADDPGNTGALKELARLELDVGNAEQAIEALTRLLAAEERDVEAHLMRAKIAYQVLNTADALQRADGFLDVVLKNHENSAGELLLPVLAHAAYVKAELGNLEEAQKLAERARATDGSYPPALFVVGRVYALQKNFAEATKALEQAVRTAQAKDQFYETVVRSELARVQALAGDAQSAIRNYEQVIEYDPRYSRAHFGLAATYMGAKPLSSERATQAMTIMRRAYENDPHYERDRPVLTDYPTPRRDLVSFADIFKGAKPVDAEDDGSLVAQQLAAEAMIRYQAGQLAEAEALTKKSLTEDRVNLFALLYLGVIELDSGRNAEARKRLRLAVDTTGTPHSVTRLYLARAEMLTGEVELARKRLQDLVDQESSMAAAAFSRAMLMRQEGLAVQASDELKKIIRNDADFMPAKRALAESP